MKPFLDQLIKTAAAGEKLRTLIFEFRICWLIGHAAMEAF